MRRPYVDVEEEKCPKKRCIEEITRLKTGTSVMYLYKTVPVGYR
jgi:hypothetical protein